MALVKRRVAHSACRPPLSEAKLDVAVDREGERIGRRVRAVVTHHATAEALSPGHAPP